MTELKRSASRRAVLLGSLLAASAGTSTSAAEPKATRLLIDTTTMTSPAMAGRVRKTFDEALATLGVTVEYTQLATSSQMLEGLVSSSADIVELGYVGVATGAAARVPFTVVGAASNGGGDVVLVRNGIPVRGIADLKGRPVAITKGSSAWALLLRALDANGLGPSALTLINLQPDEAQNAFLSGQVDAWAVWSGSKSDAVNADNSTTLVTGAEMGLIPGQIAVRTAFLDQNPALVVAYLRARQHAMDLLVNDAPATLAAIGAARRTPPARVEAFLQISAPANGIVTDQQVADLQRTADLLFKLGEIRRQVSIRGLVDNRYMAEALAAR